MVNYNYLFLILKYHNAICATVFTDCIPCVKCYGFSFFSLPFGGAEVLFDVYLFRVWINCLVMLNLKCRVWYWTVFDSLLILCCFLAKTDDHAILTRTSFPVLTLNKNKETIMFVHQYLQIFMIKCPRCMLL